MHFIAIYWVISYLTLQSFWKWYFPVPAQSGRLLAHSPLTILPTKRKDFGQLAQLLTAQIWDRKLLMKIKKQHKIGESNALYRIKSTAILKLTLLR